MQGLLSICPPEATALGFVKYNLDMPSLKLAQKLRQEASVLVAPGEHFGIENHLRITHGLQADVLNNALEQISACIERVHI